MLLANLGRALFDFGVQVEWHHGNTTEAEPRGSALAMQDQLDEIFDELSRDGIPEHMYGGQWLITENTTMVLGENSGTYEYVEDGQTEFCIKGKQHFFTNFTKRTRQAN